MPESHGQQIGGRDSNSGSWSSHWSIVLTLVHFGPSCPRNRTAVGCKVKLIPFMTLRKEIP